MGQQYKKGIPIEVLPLAYRPIQQRIKQRFGGDVKLRMAIAKAGPCVTDNGNFILDWIIPINVTFDWKEVNTEIISMAGVIETGLFISMTKRVYFGLANGEILERQT